MRKPLLVSLKGNSRNVRAVFPGFLGVELHMEVSMAIKASIISAGGVVTWLCKLLRKGLQSAGLHTHHQCHPLNETGHKTCSTQPGDRGAEAPWFR